jgi:hypothetical protein
MGIFSREQPPDEPLREVPLDGREMIREKVQNYIHSPKAYARLKQDLKLSVSDLERFAGGGELTLEQLNSLLNYFSINATLDEETGELISKSVATAFGGVTLPPYVFDEKAESYPPRALPNPNWRDGGPVYRPVVDAKVKYDPATRRYA